MYRYLHYIPLKVARAFGNYLELSNRWRILDATGGAAVSCLGQVSLCFIVGRILLLKLGSVTRRRPKTLWQTPCSHVEDVAMFVIDGTVPRSMQTINDVILLTSCRKRYEAVQRASENTDRAIKGQWCSLFPSAVLISGFFEN